MWHLDQLFRAFRQLKNVKLRTFFDRPETCTDRANTHSSDHREKIVLLSADILVVLIQILV